jgi:circadian clock protein KaiA
MPEPELTIASLLRDANLIAASAQWLRGGPYRLELLPADADPVEALEARREGIDALLLEQGTLGAPAVAALEARGLLLPAVVIGAVSGRVELHGAEVHLPPDQLEQLTYSIDAAVARFLRHGSPSLAGGGGRPGGAATDRGSAASGPRGGGSRQAAVADGQAGPGGARNAGATAGGGAAEGPQAEAEEAAERWKLANRLRDRLGYLGIYYKRDPARFLRHLGANDREELLASLTRTYRDLLLSYFRDPASANQALESFVNTAFFSDLPITRVVEIHMNLIDRFGKQLQLEGHKNDFLQDYRLALLDVMAHLCEMYRRSIPPDPPLTSKQATPVSLDGATTLSSEP